MTVRMDMGGARRKREEEQHEQAKGNGQAHGGAQQTAGVAQAPRELDFVWADDIEPAIDGPGLVDGLLGLVGISVAYGESTAGKTFVIVDLRAASLRSASGEGSILNRAWWSTSRPRRQNRSSAGSGPGKYRGVEHVPLVVVRSTVDLLSTDTDAILALLAEIRRDHGRIALVVIDTLARAMVGNDLSSEDMGRYVAACSRIREQAQTQVLSVHHCGKDIAKGARGWSGLRAATDVELEISKGCITVSKNRDERSGQTYGFRLEEVELGTNSKGRTITTCVAVETEAPARRKHKQKRGNNQQIVLEALQSSIPDNPQHRPWPKTYRSTSKARPSNSGAKPRCATCRKRKTSTSARPSNERCTRW